MIYFVSDFSRILFMKLSEKNFIPKSSFVRKSLKPIVDTLKWI